MSKKALARLERKTERDRIHASRPLPGGDELIVPAESERDPLVTVSFQWAKAGKAMCLSHCNQQQVERVVDCLRKLCSMTWMDARRSNGLRYKEIEDYALSFGRPEHVDESLRIAEIRFSEKGRIFGVSMGNVFSVLRFDPDHDGTGR